MTTSPNAIDASFDTNGTPGLLIHDPVTGQTKKATEAMMAHRGDPKGGEMNKKEFRYYESLDLITPNIL